MSDNHDKLENSNGKNYRRNKIFNNMGKSEFDFVDWHRTLALCILLLFGTGSVYYLLSGTSKITSDPGQPSPGLSPAIHACYIYGTPAYPMIIAVALGLALGISYLFGTFFI